MIVCEGFTISFPNSERNTKEREQTVLKCRNHKWVVTERSNVLQCDSMGYPVRLCICECSKCHKAEQFWLDTDLSAIKEIESGKSFLLKWEGVKTNE